MEAKTAMLFDLLDFKWEYEPYSITVHNRLNWATEERRFWEYIPDFYLPNHNVYIEVKGSLTYKELTKLLHTAAHLSTDGGAGDRCMGGNMGQDLIIIGSHTFQDYYGLPMGIHMREGDLNFYCWPFEDPHSSFLKWEVCSDNGHIETDLLSWGHPDYPDGNDLIGALMCGSIPNNKLSFNFAKWKTNIDLVNENRFETKEY